MREILRTYLIRKTRRDVWRAERAPNYQKKNDGGGGERCGCRAQTFPKYAGARPPLEIQQIMNESLVYHAPGFMS